MLNEDPDSEIAKSGTSSLWPIIYSVIDASYSCCLYPVETSLQAVVKLLACSCLQSVLGDVFYHSATSGIVLTGF